MDPSDIVHDASFPDATPVATQQRVCLSCYEEVTAAVPAGLAAARTNSLERIFIDQRRLNIPSPTRAQSSSQLSDLAECVIDLCVSDFAADSLIIGVPSATLDCQI